MNFSTAKKHSLILCVLIHSVSILAQQSTLMHLDTLNYGGDGQGFSIKYMFDVPNAPGLLMILGNNYGQPDRFTLSNESDSTLYRSPYIGRDFCDCTECVLGPVHIIDGQPQNAAGMNDCYYQYNLDSEDEYGAWSLVWNTTGTDTLYLTMRMWQDGSSWQFYPIWLPLPGVSFTCDEIIIHGDTDIERYTADSIVLTQRYHCLDYDWHIERPTISAPCDPVQIYLPNAFAPDSGGENAHWSLSWSEGANKSSYRWYIYNRQGALVSSGTGADSWDGGMRDSRAPVGVYVCVVTDASNTCVATGTITLVR